MLGVVGDLVEDIVVWLAEPIQHATDTEVATYRKRGGSAANVAAFAAPRHPTRFLGRVGEDPSGTWLVDELSSHGVDVRVQRQGTTGTVVVLIDSAGERTMLPHRGASGQLSEIDEAWTADLEHLHVPAYCFGVEPLGRTAAALIRRMHRHGGTVSVDASSTGMLRRYGQQRFRQLVADLAPQFLLANRDEASSLDLLPDAGRDLPRTTVVVKDGQHPTTVCRPGEQAFHVPVPPVDDVRDMTGAGDAFAAGFLTAVLEGADHRAACEAGHGVAARVLQAPGAASSRSY